MKATRRISGSSVLAGVAASIAAAAAGGCSAGAIDAVELAPGALFEGLIAHWSFDDGMGLTLTDSAHSYDGSLLTDANWKKAEDGHPGFGGFLHFDGSPQSEVRVPFSFQPAASWSVAGWIRALDVPTADDYATILSTEIPVNQGGLLAGGWELNFRVGTPTDPVKQKSLYQYAFWTGPRDSDYSFVQCDQDYCYVNEEWTHIAGVYDAEAQMIALYRNGSFVGSESTQPGIGIKLGLPTLYIGRWGYDTTSRLLLGDLDDFVVYDRALTLPEIKQLAQAPLPAMPP